MIHLLLALLVVLIRAANLPPIPPVQRSVHERAIISNELPPAALRFAKPFRYVGSQVVRLYGNADAEQHMFVVAGPGGVVQKFYWVQFEHFLPTNELKYNYASPQAIVIGKLRFAYDVKSWPDYAAMQNDEPASDGAAMSRLLASHHLAFPAKTARVRMFFFPTADRRSELMIIYGESPPQPDDVMLAHVAAGLRIE